MKNIKLVKRVANANAITHNGKFHLDELFSTIFLSKLMDEIRLIRLPKIEGNYENKIIYDIGLGEFDHHQKGKNGFRANGIYYSSIGLLWKSKR